MNKDFDDSDFIESRSETHDGQEFDSVIEANRRNFQPQEHHASWQLVDRLKSQSAIFKFGVKLRKQKEDGSIDVKEKAAWYCLLPNCFETQRCLSLGHISTSNVTQHLFGMHGIQTKRAKSLANRKASDAITNFRRQTMTQEDFDRHLLYGLGFLAARGVSLNLLCSDDFKKVFKFMTPELPAIYHSKLKSMLLDLFLHVKSEMSKEIKKASKAFNLPFLHFSADMYKNKVLNQKFYGARVSYVDIESKTVKGFNLAVRVFNPSITMRDKGRVSDIMAKLTNSILSSFDIKPEQILTATSDAGSDVKRLMSKCLDKPSEWCLAHLLNCALVDAFGSSQHLKNCKNVEAREVSQSIRRILEHINKSDKATQWIREKQLEEAGTTERLANFAYQRWSSAFFVYKKVLKNFNLLHAYFLEVQTMPWPPNLTRHVIEEFFSILKCTMDVMKEIQRTDSTCLVPVAAIQRVYMLLTPSSDLQIYDLNEKELEMRKFRSLNAVTRKVLQVFNDGLNRRFFDRYHPVNAYNSDKSFKFAYTFDLCQLLVPKFRSSDMLNILVEQRCQTEVLISSKDKTEFVDKISRFALNIIMDAGIKGAEGQGLEVFGAKQYESPVKTRPETKNDPYSFFLAKMKPQVRQGTKRKKGRGAAETSDKEDSPREQVERALAKEMEKYRAKNRELDRIGPEQVIEFWVDNLQSADYPILARLALAMLGAMASSAALERDFGTASDLVTNKKANFKPWTVEVLMTVKLQKDLLPDDFTTVKSRSSEHDDVIHSLSQMEDPITDMLEEANNIMCDDEDSDNDGDNRLSDGEESSSRNSK